MSVARSPRRSARRCVVWGLLCLPLLSGLLLLHAQVARPDLMAPDFYARLRLLRQRQAERPDDPLWLVIGSSRLRLGYEPETAAPIRDARGRPVLLFNYSHNGMGPVFQHINLRRLLRAGVRPARVVLEVMPLYLRREPDHFLISCTLVPDLPDAASYIPAPALLRNAARRQLDLVPDAARVLFPGDLRRLVRPNERLQFGPTRACGGPIRLPEPLAPAQRREKTFEEVQKFVGDRGYPPISPRGARALRDTLALCGREKIGVVLLLTPESELFRAVYPPGAEAEVGAFVRRLGRETGAVAVDARRWLDDEDLLDGHHTTRRGTLTLTRRLHDEVLAPLARGDGR